MVLLGRIIELISGHNYVDYLQKHIFDVAGMKDTFFPELDQVNPRIAVGYGRKWNESGLRIVNNLYDNAVKGCPAGCAYGTVSDIFCFAEAFNSSLLVSRDMAQQMTAAKPELGSPNYGFGFAVMPDRAIYGHSGGLLGASSNLDISKDPDGWVIVILANDIGMRAPTLRARQLIGVMVHEPEGSRAYLPNAGRRIR
jgi:CubicO group peptidase (beta-lactamase class C family)